MKRYHMTVYYEDRASATRVAQKIVVIEKDAKSAVEAAKAALSPLAVRGHLAAIEIKDSESIATGVVFKDEPYIPLHWPLVNRPRELAEGDETRVAVPPAGPDSRPATRSFPAQTLSDESQDEVGDRL